MAKYLTLSERTLYTILNKLELFELIERVPNGIKPSSYINDIAFGTMDKMKITLANGSTIEFDSVKDDPDPEEGALQELQTPTAKIADEDCKICTPTLQNLHTNNRYNSRTNNILNNNTCESPKVDSSDESFLAKEAPISTPPKTYRGKSSKNGEGAIQNIEFNDLISYANQCLVEAKSTLVLGYDGLTKQSTLAAKKNFKKWDKFTEEEYKIAIKTAIHSKFAKEKNWDFINMIYLLNPLKVEQYLKQAQPAKKPMSYIEQQIAKYKEQERRGEI